MEGWASANGTVTIDGSQCVVTASSYGEFTCVTSPQSGGGRRRRSSTDIIIVLSGSTVTGGSYAYSASLTPVVASISPTSSSPLGGGLLTITGTAFGAAWGKVMLGDNKCPIVTWFDNAITCTLPNNNHGNYPVHVEVSGNGYADVSTVSPVSYTFVVTNMTPRKGSTLGGTRVKITGDGFCNCSSTILSLIHI